MGGEEGDMVGGEGKGGMEVGVKCGVKRGVGREEGVRA